MFETIVRLTDEQEQFLRGWDTVPMKIDEFDRRNAELFRAVRGQLIDALALYDELVAEAKAKSDD